MSSSNLVSVRVIEESVLGTTPGAGNFDTARFTSESLSGTPETTESQQIRTDRLASGQIVTGLTVGGELNFELAYEAVLNKFIESAMLSSFVTDTPVGADLEIDTTAKELIRAAGDWNTDVAVGDFITLAGFSNAVNNTQVLVTDIVSATVIKIAFPDTLVDETDTGNTFVVCDKIGIGTTKKSFSIEKAFTDLTNKAIVYKGMMANTMSLNVAYGAIINGTFGFVGVDYYAVDAAIDFITNARTINSPATTQSLNGSIDMPINATDLSGTFDSTDFCIQSVEIALDNNNTPQNCIGESAPVDYSFGTANVTINLSAYLSNTNWEMLPKKLSQSPIALAFSVKNGDGGYGFYLPSVQLTFEDPASEGQNQDVILNMSGVAKVGANGEKSLYIYKF